MILQKQGTIHLTQPINRIPHCTIMISETDSQMHSGFSRGEWAWGVCCNCSTCVFSLNKSMNFPTTHAWYMSNWERQNDLEWFRTLNFNYWLSIVKTKYHTIADHLSGHDHLPVHISHNRIACDVQWMQLLLDATWMVVVAACTVIKTYYSIVEGI